MYLNSMFINPTVVFETAILETVPEYPEEYRYAAQDYAFFFNPYCIESLGTKC